LTFATSIGALDFVLDQTRRLFRRCAAFGTGEFLRFVENRFALVARELIVAM
jgi:hypothetical protein